jgi:hypothetical protein
MAQLKGGYMTGCVDHRSLYRFYLEVDMFHNDYHSDLKNDLPIHLGAYPDLRMTTATNLLLLSYNTPSA